MVTASAWRHSLWTGSHESPSCASHRSSRGLQLAFSVRTVVVVNVVMVVCVVVLVVAVEVVAVVVVVVVVVVLDTVVVVEEHFNPHIAGQFSSANCWWSPPATQSLFGIRSPQCTASISPWHRCRMYVVVVAAVAVVAVVVVVAVAVVAPQKRRPCLSATFSLEEARTWPSTMTRRL